jgi:hypothetical protein
LVTRFHQVIGNTVFISLDSKYDQSYAEQAPYLDIISSKYMNYAKFAIYHVPLYPGFKDDQPSWAIQEGVDAWVGRFEKYKFKGIFENHNHGFKRTKPLKGGKVDEKNGIIYFGDGAWGVPTVKITNEIKNDEGLFESIGEQNHVWIMELEQDGYKAYPIDPHGRVFAETTFVKY